MNVAWKDLVPFFQMSSEDRQAIKTLLDGMIVKHQTKQMVGNLNS